MSRIPFRRRSSEARGGGGASGRSGFRPAASSADVGVPSPSGSSAPSGTPLALLSADEGDVPVVISTALGTPKLSFPGWALA